MSEEAEAFAFARYNDGDDASVADVYLDIRDKTETTAVADIDDLLAFKIREAVSHNLTHPIYTVTVYARKAGKMHRIRGKEWGGACTKSHPQGVCPTIRR